LLAALCWWALKNNNNNTKIIIIIMLIICQNFSREQAQGLTVGVYAVVVHKSSKITFEGNVVE